jgi:hypothetical protein
LFTDTEMPGAAVGGVGERDRVPRRTGAGEEVEHDRVVGHGLEDPAHQPGRLGRLEDVPTIALSSATAVSVEPTSSAARWCAASCARPACSQSFWKTSTRARRAGLDRAADQVVGALVDRGATSATPPAAVAEDRPISWPPSNGAVRTRPVSGSPHSGKCSVRAVTGLNFLLVLRSGRCR